MEHINKNRSFSSCIREGYQLFRGNLRNIMVSAWKELLGTSLCFAALVTALACQWSGLGIGALIVLLLVCLIAFKARVFDMIDYRPYLWNMRRMAVVLGVVAVAVLLLAAPPCLAVAAALTDGLTALITAIAWTLILIVGMPVFHVCLDIMMSEKPTPARAYKDGLRRWGFIFLTVLLSTLICAVVFSVVCAPFAIALHAALADHAGIASGDPSGLPTWFPALLFLTAAVTALATLYIQTWQTFAMAFAYGSISYKQTEQ